MARLYHLPLSPFCRKVRLILAEKRIEAALIEEKPWERRADFRRLSPSGQVPALVERDGTAICDSVAIVEYLEETRPDPPLLPTHAVERAEARRVAQWFDVKFHTEVTTHLLHERVYKRMRGEGYPDSNIIRVGAANLRAHLNYISWLAANRRWLAGEAMSIADFAAAAHLSVLDYTGDVPWDQALAAKDWYARIKSRPAFRDILADRTSGLPPAPHYDDLDF
ncbi:MAG: glutathione S-transferase family protein [Rhodobacteraceae bacterium]|nr:glutathione S-transferase family protein [Paracoccaceae bacterium]